MSRAEEDLDRALSAVYLQMVCDRVYLEALPFDVVVETASGYRAYAFERARQLDREIEAFENRWPQVRSTHGA